MSPNVVPEVSPGSSTLPETASAPSPAALADTGFNVEHFTGAGIGMVALGGLGVAAARFRQGDDALPEGEVDPSA